VDRAKAQYEIHPHLELPSTLSTVRIWLYNQFDMKDLEESSYILGIKLLRDRRNRMIGLSQTAYIDKVLARFSMLGSKKRLLSFIHGVPLTKEQCPKTFQDEEHMRDVPYASVVGSLMYTMLCTRPNICFAVGMVSRYQSNPRPTHWVVVKHILKYLRRTRDYMWSFSNFNNNTTRNSTNHCRIVSILRVSILRDWLVVSIKPQ